MTFFDAIGADLGGRGIFGGSFQLRLIVQPLAAMLLGLRFGIRDAKQGRAPIVKEVAESKGRRGSLLGHAARDAIVPLVVALILDAILQQMINGRIRPLAALIVGGLLVFLPFLIVRAFRPRAPFVDHQRRRSGAGPVRDATPSGRHQSRRDAGRAEIPSDRRPRRRC